MRAKSRAGADRPSVHMGRKAPRSQRSIDGGGEAGASFSGSRVLCAAPGFGQRSKVKVTEQARPLRPGALGPLDVCVRKANLGTDLAPFTKSAPMGRGPDGKRRPSEGPQDARRSTGARGVEAAADGARSPACERSGGRAGGTRTESFCCSEASLQRIRRQATGQEKIFAKDTSNKYTKNSQSSTVRTATIHFKDGPEPPMGASHAGGVERVNTLPHTPRDQTQETVPRARRRRGPEHQVPAGRGAAGGHA